MSVMFKKKSNFEYPDKIFLGYHGCNMSSATDIVENGLNPDKMGCGQGQGRGPGFYVAYKYNMAKEYAKQSTIEWIHEDENGNPLKEDFSIFKDGDEGVETVLLVYSNQGYKNGTIDYQNKIRYIKHGVESSDGDENGDASPFFLLKKGSKDPELLYLSNTLEMVIRPNEYRDIECKVMGENFDTTQNGNFPNHEI